MSVWILPTIFV